MAPNPTGPHYLGDTSFIILFLAPGFAQSTFAMRVVQEATKDREGMPSIRWVEVGNDSVIDCPKDEIPLVVMTVPFKERGRIEAKYRVRIPSLILVTDHGNLVHDIDRRSYREQPDVEIAHEASIDGFVSAARKVRDHERRHGDVRASRRDASGMADRIETIGRRYRLGFWQGAPSI